MVNDSIKERIKVERVKIVFLLRSFNCGGTENSVIALAKGLNKRVFDLTVICFYGGGPLEKHLIESGIALVRLGKRGRWDLLGFSYRLLRQLGTLKPLILHSFLVEPNILTVLLKLWYPRLRVVWGIQASEMGLSHYDWFARLTFKIQCLLSRFADLIIVNSYAGRTYHLERGFPAKKTLVISNGFDAERYRSRPSSRKSIRREWNVSDDTCLIGIVARLDPAKDHATFLRAVSLLAQQKSNVRFVCIGTGPMQYEHDLKELARNLDISDKVIWAGERSDMPAVYNAFDIATLSSVFEGSPFVIGEAMASGVPFVATDVGDAKRVVGDTGIVVPQKSPRLLASAWLSLLTKDPSQLGARARQRIVKEFGLKQTIERTESAILALLGDQDIPLTQYLLKQQTSSSRCD